MVYVASIRAELDSLLLRFFIFSLMFSQALFMSSPSLKFSKAANLFVISIWFCFLTSSSISSQRLNLSTSNSLLLVYLLANISLAFETTRYRSISQSNPLKDRTSSTYVYSNAISCLSICGQSGCVPSHQERPRHRSSSIGPRCTRWYPKFSRLVPSSIQQLW